MRLHLAILLVFNLQAADKPKAAKGKLISIQGISAAIKAKLEKAGMTSVCPKNRVPAYL